MPHAKGRHGVREMSRRKARWQPCPGLSKGLGIKARARYFHAAIPSLPRAGGVTELATPTLFSHTPGES